MGSTLERVCLVIPVETDDEVRIRTHAKQYARNLFNQAPQVDLYVEVTMKVSLQQLTSVCQLWLWVTSVT